METDLELYQSPEHARGKNYISFSITPIIVDAVAVIVRDADKSFLDRVFKDVLNLKIVFEVSLN